MGVWNQVRKANLLFRRIDNGVPFRENSGHSSRLESKSCTRATVTFSPLFPFSMLTLFSPFAGPAGATTYTLDEGQPLVFGTVEHYSAKYEDTITDIARRFSLGWEEIQRAIPQCGSAGFPARIQPDS